MLIVFNFGVGALTNFGHFFPRLRERLLKKNKSKGKHGRKRKSVALEVDVLELKAKKLWISEVLEPETSRAPAVRMY